MPRAEAGSIKHLSNKMKSKGLQRLRWYCQPCEKQCRDENGYKCHVMSESHMRNMQLVTEDPRKHIANYSQQFKRDFLQLLRTSHGEKPVHVNQFYQEYIRDKDHIHMNATQWSSLTEFAKYLGREGICRVSEEEKGVYIAWIDNSPEALKRREYLKKKEAERWGDEQLQQKLLREQERRAKREARREGKDINAKDEGPKFERKEGERIKFSLGPKPEPETTGTNANDAQTKSSAGSTPAAGSPSAETQMENQAPAEQAEPARLKLSLSVAAPAPKPVNAFAAAKKANAFKQAKKASAFADDMKSASATGSAVSVDPPKRMSNMERIMQEELERNKRKREGPGGFGSFKKVRTAS